MVEIDLNKLSVEELKTVVGIMDRNKEDAETLPPESRKATKEEEYFKKEFGIKKHFKKTRFGDWKERAEIIRDYLKKHPKKYFSISKLMKKCLKIGAGGKQHITLGKELDKMPDIKTIHVGKKSVRYTYDSGTPKIKRSWGNHSLSESNWDKQAEIAREHVKSHPNKEFTIKQLLKVLNRGYGANNQKLRKSFEKELSGIRKVNRGERVLYICDDQKKGYRDVKGTYKFRKERMKYLCNVMNRTPTQAMIQIAQELREKKKKAFSNKPLELSSFPKYELFEDSENKLLMEILRNVASTSGTFQKIDAGAIIPDIDTIGYNNIIEWIFKRSSEIAQSFNIQNKFRITTSYGTKVIKYG